MIICRVIGHVWATKKEPRLESLKLMVVREEMGRNAGKVYVAADCVGAGRCWLSRAARLSGHTAPAECPPTKQLSEL